MFIAVFTLHRPHSARGGGRTGGDCFRCSSCASSHPSHPPRTCWENKLTTHEIITGQAQIWLGMDARCGDICRGKISRDPCRYMAKVLRPENNHLHWLCSERAPPTRRLFLFTCPGLGVGGGERGSSFWLADNGFEESVSKWPDIRKMHFLTLCYSVSPAKEALRFHLGSALFRMPRERCSYHITENHRNRIMSSYTIST